MSTSSSLYINARAHYGLLYLPSPPRVPSLGVEPAVGGFARTLPTSANHTPPHRARFDVVVVDRLESNPTRHPFHIPTPHSFTARNEPRRLPTNTNQSNIIIQFIAPPPSQRARITATRSRARSSLLIYPSSFHVPHSSSPTFPGASV